MCKRQKLAGGVGFNTIDQTPKKKYPDFLIAYFADIVI
jgi:hypothetical protein